MYNMIKDDTRGLHATSNMHTFHKLAPLPWKFLDIFKMNTFSFNEMVVVDKFEPLVVLEHHVIVH